MVLDAAQGAPGKVFGVVRVSHYEADGHGSTAEHRTSEEEEAMTVIKSDAAAFARAIREQKALPITDGEAERFARAIETSSDDEELLANAVRAIQVLVSRLDDCIPAAPTANCS